MVNLFKLIIIKVISMFHLRKRKFRIVVEVIVCLT